MAFGLDLVELVDEFLVGADDVGGALDAGDQLAVHGLGFDDAEAVADGLVGVGKERVLEIVLFGELLLRLDGVARDAEDYYASLLQFCEMVAKAAGFDGAARGVGLGIEEEYDGLAGEVGEVDDVAVLIRQGEIFYDVADLHGADLPNL